ncbi:MAG: hypothetical protein ACM30G_13485 [Micromonosporaceae bacterium]
MPTTAVPLAHTEPVTGRPGILSRTPLRLIVWTTGAIVAIGVATAAVVAATGGRNILSADDVAAQLAAAGPSGAEPGNEVLDPGVPAGPGTVVGTPGGTVVVQCRGDLTALVSWSPNPGFRADHVVRGPATRASLWFESDTAEDVQVEVTCHNGTPTARQQVEADDHGGRGHNDGGSSGPGGG